MTRSAIQRRAPNQTIIPHELPPSTLRTLGNNEQFRRGIRGPLPKNRHRAIRKAEA